MSIKYLIFFSKAYSIIVNITKDSVTSYIWPSDCGKM